MGRLTRPDQSVLGAHRLGYADLVEHDEETIRIKQMLARALQVRSVVAFVGSGLSRVYGYPSWDEMFKHIRSKAEAELEARSSGLSPRTQSLWRAYEQHENDARITASDAGLAFVGSCDADLARAGSPRRAQEIVRERWREIAQQTRDEPSHDPLLVLMRELEIRQFFTLNYDDCIERVWKRAHALDDEARSGSEPGHATLQRLTVVPAHPDRAVAFACRADPRPSVYHGHGCASDDDDRLIVGDEDYRDRYAGFRPADVAYREGLELLQNAGALLFVGIGMEEREIMRPMRELLAAHRGDYEAPFFAILNSRSDSEDRVERLYFRQAYGVHLLHYTPDESVPQNIRHEKALCELLRDVVSARRRWYDAWQRIPAAREPRYELVRPRLMAKIRAPGSDDVPPSVDIPHDHPVTFVHVRSPGYASQQIAYRVAEQIHDSGSQRVFVANLFLTTDLLTVVEAAGDFLAGKPRDHDHHSPLDYLFLALRNEGHALVLSGVDRLLQPEGMRATGVAALTAVDEHANAGLDDPPLWIPRGNPSGVMESRFFRYMNSFAGEMKGRIVLVASHAPPLDKLALRPYRDGADLPRTDVAVVTPIEQPSDAWVRSVGDQVSLRPGEKPHLHHLHRLLRAHGAALHQIVGWMRALSAADDREEQLFELRTQVSVTERTLRPMRVLRLTLRELRRSSGPWAQVLTSLAHFTAPVSPAVICAVLKVAPERAAVPWTVEGVADALRVLQQRGFCYPTTCELGDVTYAPVHGVRQWLGETLRGFAGDAWSAVPQRFSLPGATRDPDFERSLTASALESIFRQIEQLTRHAAEAPNRDAARDYFRAALDLVRTHLGLAALRRCHEAVRLDEEPGKAASRPLYPRYHRLLLRLANLLQDSHAEHSYAHHRTSRELDDRHTWSGAWLYAGEIIWLCNELALIPYTEGQIQDTVPHFRKSFRAQRVVDGRRRTWRWTREQMFEGAVLIDRAKLERAHHVLKEARSVARDASVEAADIRLRCEGYLGLCRHLMGDYHGARKRYDEVIKGLEERRNFRAQSITYRLRGDLKRHLGETDAAERDLEAAIRAAERGRHPDLVMWAQISRVLLWAREQRGRDHNLEALSHDLAVRHRQLDVIRDYALSVGSKRIEVNGNVARITLQLIGGDLEHAWMIARHNLATTRKYGLMLDFIRMLAIAGHLSYKRGAQDSELIRAGRVRAERAGFVHALHRIRRVEARGGTMGK